MKKSLMRYFFSWVFFSDNTILFGIICHMGLVVRKTVFGGGGGGGGVSTKSVSNQSPQLKRLA